MLLGIYSSKRIPCGQCKSIIFKLTHIWDIHRTASYTTQVHFGHVSNQDRYIFGFLIFWKILNSIAVVPDQMETAAPQWKCQSMKTLKTHRGVFFQGCCTWSVLDLWTLGQWHQRQSKPGKRKHLNSQISDLDAQTIVEAWRFVLLLFGEGSCLSFSVILIKFFTTTGPRLLIYDLGGIEKNWKVVFVFLTIATFPWF